MDDAQYRFPFSGFDGKLIHEVTLVASEFGRRLPSIPAIPSFSTAC